ncbi:MAG: glycoside hydrolase family 127 protein [Verrucomicrobia bacterium]|nr:glycoside hydrolase family 127 protein [Verrucomicrobiota bacterium]
MRPIKTVLCLVVALLEMAGTPRAADEVPTPRGLRVLEPFDYRGVTLEPGPLKSQVDEVRKFYLQIPNEDLLKGFRRRAGLPAPGNELGGWYRSDTFHVFGQIVSGLARLYAGTGDPACRAKADYLVSEWAKCIAPDGYFYADPKPNAPHYIFDKTVWGLLDDYRYCGDRAALDDLSRITDWAIAHLERSRRVNDTSTEWYTLSENLYRAYLTTGDAKYRDFARVWEYHDYWDIYARNGDIFAPRPNGQHNDSYHAYSHVNTLGGAGAAYRVTGQSHYLDTLKNAFDFLQRDEVFATGGFGPDEQLLPRAALAGRLKSTHATFETQCGSWAAFKLAKHLITFTGDARYGDWIERLVLNGIGASIPMTRDGRVFYYSDYCLNGGCKQNTDFGWSCCTGTRPQAVADYNDLIYFKNAQDLCVNLFTSSSVRWTCQDTAVVVRQSTRFPLEPTVRFDVSVERPVEFALQLRVPGWLAGAMRAAVNGRSVALHPNDRHWATVRRRWQDRDRVRVTLPEGLWACPLEPPARFPTAVLDGPTVLAFRAPDVGPLRRLDPANLARSLKPVPGHPLEFRLASDASVLAQPFASYREGERYFVYLDPGMRNQVLPSQISFQGDWHRAGSFRFSNQIGASAECAFTGTGVRWLGFRFDDAGRAEVTIDGRWVDTVDQFGPGRELPFDWVHRGLAPGPHRIQLRIVPKKAPASKDHYLNVAGFEVLNRAE